jgi:hypothetical protein
VHGGQQKRIGDVLKNKTVVFACVFCKKKLKEKFATVNRRILALMKITTLRTHKSTVTG